MADNTMAKKLSSLPRDPSAKGKPRQGESRTMQLFMIVLLLLCCVGSFYFFRSTMMIITGEQQIGSMQMPEPDVASINEGKELAGTETELNDMGKATSLALQTALLAEISGKYPVAPADAIIPKVPGKTADGQDIMTDELEPIELEPPTVTLVAVMITDTGKIAMVDVLGEDGGLIVREGTVFSGGTAKITKIDAKGVTFTWMKKSYQVSMQP